MNDVIGSVSQAAATSPSDGQSRLDGGGKGSGGRSFESVLRAGEEGASGSHGGGASAAPPGVSSPAQLPTGTSGARIERMRVELMNDYGRILPAGARRDQLFPDFFNTRTRLGLLKEAMSGVGGTGRGVDFLGRFGQLENRWKGVEQDMMSNRDLSTGELLGLQARLYQVSQHIEVMSKVVDQVTGGIKSILNTNV